MSPLSRNPRLLCIFHALQMSLFPMAVITVYFRDDIRMSMQEIMLLQGTFGLAMALFEFPSGYIADRMGYRRAMILASILAAVGWSIYVRADSLPHIFVAEAVLGIALSLVSGTDAALLYESLLETGNEGEFGRWNGRVRFFGQLGEGSAAIVAGFLYAYWHRLPFLVEVVVWVVNLWVALRLVEPARHRPPLQENWKQVKSMVSFVLRDNVRLRAIVVLTIVLGMSSFVPVWTIQLYATDAGVPERALGLVWAAANYTVAIGSLFSSRLAEFFGLRALIVLCVLLVAVGYAGMGLSHALWGFAFYFVLTTMRGINVPALHHEEHREIPSSDRAGFVSLRSLAFRSIFMVLGPLVGAGVDRFGQHPVLLVLGGAFVVLACAGLALMQRAGVFASLRARD